MTGDESDAGGTYTLLVDLRAAARIEVGALGERRFEAGPYAYTGSALGAGGFSRVDRHRRTARGDHDVRHWHVDHLLGHPDARIDRVVRSVGVDVECAVADRLPAGPADGFGSSDCGCRSHLAALAGDGADGAVLDDIATGVRAAHEAEATPLGGRVDIVTGSDRPV
ncbi:MAG: GIY-YIG nuclease family protein [Halorubrum sp.]